MQEMTEISRIRQEDSSLHKRWFTSASEDLYVWTKAGQLQCFEYCFDKDNTERAIRWHHDYAPAFAQVDTGDHPGGYKMSPIYLTGYKPDIAVLLSRFARTARTLESSLHSAIADKIQAL